MDEEQNFCIPESPTSQAMLEISAPFRSTPKMERCIQDVKSNLRKSRKNMDAKAIKSAAIAICRSRLKQ